MKKCGKNKFWGTWVFIPTDLLKLTWCWRAIKPKVNNLNNKKKKNPLHTSGLYQVHRFTGETVIISTNPGFISLSDETFKVILAAGRSKTQTDWEVRFSLTTSWIIFRLLMSEVFFWKLFLRDTIWHQSQLCLTLRYILELIDQWIGDSLLFWPHFRLNHPFHKIDVYGPLMTKS